MQSIFSDQKAKKHYCEADKFERDLYIESVLCWLGTLDADSVRGCPCFWKHTRLFRDNGISCLSLSWLMVVGICIKNMDDGVVTIKESKKRKFRTFFVFFLKFSSILPTMLFRGQENWGILYFWGMAASHVHILEL